MEKENFPIDIVCTHIPCGIPPILGKDVPTKISIFVVSWFTTIISLSVVTIPEYSISSDPRSQSGDEKNSLDALP
jgi:hypothetical protein